MNTEMLDILKEKNSSVLQVGSVFYYQNVKYKVLHIEERLNNGKEHVVLKVKVINT